MKAQKCVVRRALPSALVAAASFLGVPATTLADEKRELPDYDGRDEPTTPRDLALWVPRAALFPAYLVSEFVVRRPLGYAITRAEQAELPAALYNFFAFGPDNKAGVVPFAFIDFGFDPSVGVYMFWDDAGFDGHDLRLRASTWGQEWIAGAVTERFTFSEQRDLTLEVLLSRRPDYAFYGLGSDTLESALSRYGSDLVDASATFYNRFFGASSVTTALGYRGASFYPGNYDGDPSITAEAEAGTFPLPPGYDDGYRAVVSSATVVLDTRTTDEVNSGGRLQIHAEQGTDLAASGLNGWVRYGGTVGGVLDLSDSGRDLSLSGTAELADPLGAEPVPFSELVALGGPGLMPGFRDGRLHARSALVGTLRYSWPIWIWLNGSLQASVGNVFGAAFEGASLSRSRLSAAVGIESIGSRDSIFQALLGFGTETFDNGAEVNSIRFTVGARDGF